VERPTQEGAEQQAQSAPQDEQAEPAAPEPDWKEQYEKARNQLLRVAADFENYKKRAKRDSQDAAHRARDEVLQEFLPVIDNLERALGHAEASEVQDAASLVAGVQMVLRSFQAGMERFGLKGFDSLGQVFDPNLHEALSLRESSDVTPGSVLEEFRRGYHLGERLIRPALVVVAKAPAAAAAESPDAGEPSKSPVDESVRASSDTPAPAPSTGGDEAPANEPPAWNQGGGSLEEGRQA
jgi:molecular chaperone GrpE